MTKRIICASNDDTTTPTLQTTQTATQCPFRSATLRRCLLGPGPFLLAGPDKTKLRGWRSADLCLPRKYTLPLQAGKMVPESCYPPQLSAPSDCNPRAIRPRAGAACLSCAFPRPRAGLLTAEHIASKYSLPTTHRASLLPRAAHTNSHVDTLGDLPACTRPHRRPPATAG